MLLSLEKKFLFIHIPKTAGLSITATLKPYSLEENRTSLRRFLSHFPIRENPEKAYFRVHTTAQTAKVKIGEELFSDLYKFAVVRNPYDRAVSYYLYIKKSEKHNWHRRAKKMSFLEFLLMQEASNKRWDQSYFVEDTNGQLLVDNVIYFERLNSEFAKICETLGVPSEELPHLNRSSNEGYREHYNDDAKAVVERMYKKDLDRFDYEF